MVYVLQVEIKLIFMMFPVAAIFRSAICQNTQDWNLFAVKEGNDTIIEHIGGNQCVFPVIQFGKCHFGIGVNHGLLVDPSNTFHVTDIEGILSNQVTYSTDKSIPANLVTISSRRAFEIISMNKKGIKPDSLLEEANKAEPKKPVDLLEQESVTRFDRNKKEGSGSKNKKKKKKGNNNPAAQQTASNNGNNKEGKGNNKEKEKNKEKGKENKPQNNNRSKGQNKKNGERPQNQRPPKQEKNKEQEKPQNNEKPAQD